jgi:UDPglucose--hexose-1-phosphate uridylyltransferase
MSLTRSVRRTHSRMADGRDLFYFDDTEPYVSGQATRAVPDPRPLPPRDLTGLHRRLDPLTGDWVAVAAQRNTRTFLPPANECPLCPTGRGVIPSEIPAPDYDVVVFENRFPSLSLDTTGGRCEVVCFTADHETSFAQLSESRVRTVIEAWADRTHELSALPGVEQVFCFENRGKEIGVTLHHPHGQIYAYPYVAPRTEAVLRQAEAHHARTGGYLMRDVLEQERREAERIVLTGEHWIAYVPKAARWPLEVHLAPVRDVPDLPALHEEEREELAIVYRDLLRRLDRYHPEVDTLPYIAGWHQAPVTDPRRDLVRLQLQVFSLMRAPGRMKFLAGSESAMGAFINDVEPETVAARLREVAGD